MPTSSLHDLDPTPEFDRACQMLLEAWSSGALPLVDALTQLQTLEQNARAEKHLANQGRVAHVLGYIYQDLGDVNRSIEHYDKAQRFFLRVNNRMRLAGIDLNQGENYRDKGDYARALALCQRAYKVADEIEHNSIKTYARGNQGWVFLALNDSKSALEAFEDAYVLCQEDIVEHNDSTMAELLCGMAHVALYRGDNALAWEKGYQAYEAAMRGGEQREIGYVWRVMGDAVTGLGDCPIATMPSSPDTYYKSAIAAFQHINADAEIARTIFARAKSLVKRGNRVQASPLFREAMVIFTRLGLTHDALQVAEAQLK